MAKPETRTRRKIQAALIKEFPGCPFYKIYGNPFQDAGLPDLIGVVKGIFVGLEVKEDDDDEASVIQLHRIKEINRAGGVAGVVRTPEEAIAFVRREVQIRMLS